MGGQFDETHRRLWAYRQWFDLTALRNGSVEHDHLTIASMAVAHENIRDGGSRVVWIRGPLSIGLFGYRTDAIEALMIQKFGNHRTNLLPLMTPMRAIYDRHAWIPAS